MAGVSAARARAACREEVRSRAARATRKPVRFRRADYLGDPRVPLERAVRDRIASQTGHRPEGPIALLTQLCYLGYVFNPVSFFYCFDAAGRRSRRSWPR